MQGMIFNLWQAIDVLKQNVPGHPANDDGGLLPVMRDLFFEVYYSNPPSVLSQPFSSALVDQNQLVVVSQFLRLGVMHQVGLILHKFELNDPNLKAVFLSLMRGASSPEMPKLLRGLLHRDPEDHLIWSAIRGLTRAQGSQVDELKRLAFYLLAGMNRVDPWGGAQRDSVHSSIVDRALARSHEVTDEFYGWFASLGSAGVGGSSHRDISRLIEKLLDSKWGSSLAEALHQTMAASAAPSGVAALLVEAEGQQEDRPDRWRRLLLNALREPQDSTSRSEVSALIHLAKSTWEDAGAWDSWGRFFVEAQRVQNDRDYQGLSVSAALRPFLDFIEEKEVPSAEVLGPLGAGMSGGEARQVGGVPNGIPRAAAARELRQNLAKFVRYKQGSRSTALNELIQLAAEKPEEFDLLLRVLEQSIQGGQLIDFLKLVRRSLPE
jgi:hypothetical protein